MNFIKSKNELEFTDKFDEFMHHTLFDEYLNPNIGNDYMASLKAFAHYLDNYETKIGANPQYGSLREVYGDAESIYKKYNKTFILPNLFGLSLLLSTGGDYESYKKTGGLTSMQTYLDLSLVDYTIGITSYNKKITDLNIKKILSFNSSQKSERFKAFIEILSEHYKDLILDTFNNVKSKKRALIISGQYEKNLRSGHLITFFCELESIALSSETWTITMFNSGSGLKNHNHNHKPTNNKYQGIVQKQNFTDDKFKQFLLVSFLFRYVFSSSIDEYYTYFVNEYFTNPKTNDNLTTGIKDEGYISQQMSGSCTYFGFYYMIKYFFDKYIDKTAAGTSNDSTQFATFDSYIKNGEEQTLLNYIGKKPKYECWKNYVDILKFKGSTSTAIDTFYDRYIDAATKCTQFSSITTVPSQDFPITVLTEDLVLLPKFDISSKTKLEGALKTLVDFTNTSKTVLIDKISNLSIKTHNYTLYTILSFDALIQIIEKETLYSSIDFSMIAPYFLQILINNREIHDITKIKVLPCLMQKLHLDGTISLTTQFNLLLAAILFKANNKAPQKLFNHRENKDCDVERYFTICFMEKEVVPYKILKDYFHLYGAQQTVAGKKLPIPYNDFNDNAGKTHNVDSFMTEMESNDTLKNIYVFLQDCLPRYKFTKGTVDYEQISGGEIGGPGVISKLEVDSTTKTLTYTGISKIDSTAPLPKIVYSLEANDIKRRHFLNTVTNNINQLIELIRAEKISDINDILTPAYFRRSSDVFNLGTNPGDLDGPPLLLNYLKVDEVDPNIIAFDEGSKKCKIDAVDISTATTTDTTTSTSVNKIGILLEIFKSPKKYTLLSDTAILYILYILVALGKDITDSVPLINKRIDGLQTDIKKHKKLLRKPAVKGKTKLSKEDIDKLITHKNCYIIFQTIYLTRKNKVRMNCRIALNSVIKMYNPTHKQTDEYIFLCYTLYLLFQKFARDSKLRVLKMVIKETADRDFFRRIMYDLKNIENDPKDPLHYDVTYYDGTGAEKTVKLLNTPLINAPEQLSYFVFKKFMFIQKAGTTYVLIDQNSNYEDLELVVQPTEITISSNFGGEKYSYVINAVTNTNLPGQIKEEIAKKNVSVNYGLFLKAGTDINDYYLEFHDAVGKTGTPARFHYYNNGAGAGAKYWFNDGTSKYEVINTEFRGLFNRWIYGIPLAFMLKKENEESYYILLIEVVHSLDHLEKSPWTDKSNLTKDIKIELNRYIKDKKFGSTYHIIPVSYNGLDIDIPNSALNYYIFSCVCYNKAEALSLISNKYLVSYDQEDENLFVKHNLFNNPYSFYFNYKYNQNYRDIDATKDGYIKIHKAYRDRIFTFPDLYKDSEDVSEKKKKIIIPDYSEFSEKFTDFYGVKGREKIKDFFKKIKIDTHLNEKVKKYSSLSNESKGFINEFNSKYYYCTLDSSQYFKIEENTYAVQKYFPILFKSWVINAMLKGEGYVIKFISKNYTGLYYILFYKLLTDVMCGIHKHASKMTSCIELKRIYDLIDPTVIYTGKRPIYMATFEILFGYLVRQEQYIIFDKISNEIDEKLPLVPAPPVLAPPTPKTYSVFQMLMGRGKTSTIMPLIMFKYLYTRDEFKNIILLMPHHLITQTSDAIIRKFSSVLNGASFRKVTNIKRHTETGEGGFIEKFQGNNNIILIDDMNIKTLLLNSRTRAKDTDPQPIADPKTLEIIREHSLIIIDEFDSLYNPLKSNLNFPIKEVKLKTKENKMFREDLYIFLVLFIKHLFETGQDKEATREELAATYNNFIESYEPFFDIAPYIRNLVPVVITSATFTGITKEKFSKLKSLQKLFNTLDEMLKLIFQKDYGFPNIIPNSITHTNAFMAVPYGAVNDPIKGSQFSEIDINIILTIMTYYYSEFRQVDILNIIDTIKDKIAPMKRAFGPVTTASFFGEYTEAFGKGIDKLKSIKEEDIEEIYAHINSSDLRNKRREFITSYIKNTIIPNISYSIDFYNCSFIDIIAESFSRYKTGFTGTLSLELPKFFNDEFQFTRLEKNKEDEGAVMAAMLNLIDDTLTNNVDQPLQFDTNDENVLGRIITILKKNKYNSFIDCGAFLIKYTSNEVIHECANQLSFNYFVYIDYNDKKKVFNKSKKEFYDYNDEIYPTDKLFIYYDNKHIIGIDIKQPFILSGLVSVNKFNVFSDIAQASFRLRHLNYGQTANFLINKKVRFNGKPIKTRLELLNHLKNKEDKLLKEEVEVKKLIQNLKYLKRELSGFVQESYKENLYADYLEFLEVTSSSEFEEGLKDTKKTTYYLKYFKKLFDIPTNLPIAESKKSALEPAKIGTFNDLKDSLVTLVDQIDIIGSANDIQQEQEQEMETSEEQQKEQAKEQLKEIEALQPPKVSGCFDLITRERSFTKDDYMLDNKKRPFRYPDKFSVTNSDLYIMNLLEFYLSPLFDYSAFKFSFEKELEESTSVAITEEQKREKQKKEYARVTLQRDLLLNYNYYYIYSNKRMLAITPTEFELLYTYITKPENQKSYSDKGIEIKNKFGQIVFPPGPKLYKVTLSTAQEPFVKFLLGGPMIYEDYIDLLYHFEEQIKSRGANLNFSRHQLRMVIDCFAQNYGLRFSNKDLLEKYWKSESVITFRDEVSALPEEEFLNLMTGINFSELLITDTSKKKIKDIQKFKPRPWQYGGLNHFGLDLDYFNGFRNINSMGGFSTVNSDRYYLKYKKYKQEYLRLKFSKKISSTSA